MSLEEKVKELEKRLVKIEHLVFRKKSTVPLTSRMEAPSELKLEMLKIPNEILPLLQEQIRKISYWNVVLVLLYFAPRPLKYTDMMNLSSQLRKPVSYNWLNTEFHREKYSGLVRSEPISGSAEKNYILNEPGRRRAEAFLAKLKSGKS